MSGSARKRLPVHPSHEHLRKQARRRANDDGVPLATAQHRVAREYGARHWAELTRMVTAMRRNGDVAETARHDFEALPAAVEAGDRARVAAILAAGDFTPHDLDRALARAVLRFAERADLARLLLAHGADPDGQYGAGYGPIVLVTGEALDVDGLRFLLDAGCDVGFAPVATKYGPACALGAWLGSYLRGAGDRKRRGVDVLLARGAYVPPDVTPLALALHRDDAAGLAHALAEEPGLIDRRFAALPYVDIAGATLLHAACALGASACIAALVAHGADVNARTAAGVLPIHAAARGATVDDVRLLLDRGAHGWVTDAQGRDAAAIARAAVANPAREAIARLLSEVTLQDAAMTRAIALIDAGDVDGLRALLAAEPRLARARIESDSALVRGYFARPTLLHVVANNPNRGDRMPPRIVDSARVLLDAGAEVDATTGHALGGTTLALVASSGPAHADGLVAPLVELLVARGAAPRHGIRAAMLHRFADTVRLLLRLGAPHTAISAAGLGDHAVLAALIAAGLTDEERLHAGWAAAMNGQPDAIAALVADGLDVDARLPRPFAPTMLHEAAINGQRAACERLLALGADRTIEDTFYQGTPSGWARHAGHDALADLLA